MGQCNSKQQQVLLEEEQAAPIKITKLHINDDNVGGSATSNSTAHRLAKYIAENPLDFSSKSHSRRRRRGSTLRDSAAAPVGADMDCSSSTTMNLSSSCLRSSLEMSSTNISLGNSNKNNNSSSNFQTRRQAGGAGAGGMDFLDLSSSHGAGGGQLDPLPEDMPVKISDDTTNTASEALQKEDKREKRSSLGGSSRRRRSRNDNNSSSTSLRGSKTGPHPAMDVSTNEKVLKKENSKKNMTGDRNNKEQTQQSNQPQRQGRRSVRSETAMTQQLRQNNKQDSVRQSLQVTDLDRSKLGVGKDSSWQGMSCTSANSQLYESYENSGNSLQMSQSLRFVHPSSQQQAVGEGGTLIGVMDLSRMEKDAMANMHGFCFTESDDEDDSSTSDDEEEQEAEAGPNERVCNIHVTVRIE